MTRDDSTLRQSASSKIFRLSKVTKTEPLLHRKVAAADAQAETEVAVVTEADAAADSAVEIAVAIEAETEVLDETALAQTERSDQLPAAASLTSESDSKLFAS